MLRAAAGIESQRQHHRWYTSRAYRYSTFPEVKDCACIAVVKRFQHIRLPPARWYMLAALRPALLVRLRLDALQRVAVAVVAQVFAHDLASLTLLDRALHPLGAAPQDHGCQGPAPPPSVGLTASLFREATY